MKFAAVINLAWAAVESSEEVSKDSYLDEGVLLELPERPYGEVEGYELEVNSSLTHSWPLVADGKPYYEWIIDELRMERLEGSVGLEESSEAVDLDAHSEETAGSASGEESFSEESSSDTATEASAKNKQSDDAERGSEATADEVEAVQRILLGRELQDSDSLVALSSLLNEISSSVANVAQSGGEVLGLTTTPAPLNDAVQGFLNVLQGFNQMAKAVRDVYGDGLDAIGEAADEIIVAE